MDARQLSRFDGIKRVAGFGDQYTAEFRPATPATGPTKAQRLFAELGTTADINAPGGATSVVGILGRVAATQLEGGRDFTEGTISRAGLRQKLRTTLADLRKDARAIGAARGTRSVLKDFPAGRKRADTALGIQARAFAKAVEPLRAELTELEYPGDFIEGLLADVAALENARDDQHAGARDRSGASMDIDKQIQRAAVLIAQLDAIMRKKFGDRPEMLLKWRAASRIEPVARRQAARVVALPGPVARVALPALAAEAPVLAPEPVPEPVAVAESPEPAVEAPMRVKVIRARRKLCRPVNEASEPEQTLPPVTAVGPNGFRTGAYD